MSLYLDSSVLLCSLLPDDPDFAACDILLAREGNWTMVHALNETFATLTGGRLGVRIDAGVAAAMIRESILPRMSFVELSARDVVTAQSDARQQGVRGGAIYDYMHLVAARKVGAEVLVTLNFSDFSILRRDGDPLIKRP